MVMSQRHEAMKASGYNEMLAIQILLFPEMSGSYSVSTEAMPSLPCFCDLVTQ